ncbi:MAG: ABC-2 family transporter protein [Defluviitaleaceae bacterium]|nr:ABC-2 family transporter protein [Defluviitaleaceae bacterium]
MKALMVNYYILMKLHAKNYLKFPMNIFLKLIYIPVQMFMYFLLWRTLIPDGASDFRFMLAYYLLVCLLTQAYPFVHIASGVMTDVMEGNIMSFMVRPVQYGMRALSKYSSWMMFYSIVFIPALIFVYIYMDLSLYRIALFIIFAVIGMLIEFICWYAVGLASLFMERIKGLVITVLSIRMFVSGIIIPLTFFPDNIRSIAYFFPFRFYIFVPVNLLLSGWNNYWFDLALAIMWLVLLYLLSRMLWAFGVKRLGGAMS